MKKEMSKKKEQVQKKWDVISNIVSLLKDYDLPVLLQWDDENGDSFIASTFMMFRLRFIEDKLELGMCFKDYIKSNDAAFYSLFFSDMIEGADFFNIFDSKMLSEEHEQHEEKFNPEEFNLLNTSLK